MRYGDDVPEACRTYIVAGDLDGFDRIVRPIYMVLERTKLLFDLLLD
jgi:hypothetical protein